MDSKYAQQQHNGVTAQEKVPPSSPSLLVPRRGSSSNGVSMGITQGDENFVVVGRSLHQGDLDCTAIRFHGDGLDVIFSVDGAFKRAKLIVRHEGTEGQPPIIQLFLMVDLSDRVHEWVWDFAVQVMERMCGNTRHQMYNAILAFCSAVCTNSLSPPLINCTSLYLGTTLHPTGKSASITGFTVNENDANEYRPWDELQLDCCRLIRDCLDAFSVLNFPLVCKTWKGVYAEKRRLQPGAPTLLTSPSLDGGCTVLDEHHRGLFFLQNILSRETFSIELDSLRYHNWIGGKDEWMVITDLQDSINVLNPITGACSDLFHDQMIMYWAQRIQLCQTPAEADGYFAIAISHSRLAYTTVESGQWIMLENPNHKMYMRYCDAILHRGKIVAICSNSDLWSWDLNEQGAHPKQLLRPTISFAGWEEYDFILAPSLNGNLLIVSPYGESLPIRLACNRSTFRNRWNFTVLGAVIREVDTDAQSLEDVHGIGNWALFLGPNYPFFVPVSVPSGDLKKNHLYITDISDYDVVAIDLGDQELPGKATEINYNGPASHPYQVPMWFRPAFP